MSQSGGAVEVLTKGGLFVFISSIVQVEARTQEAPPGGTVVLTASVVDARTVSVQWTRPDQGNGLLFFDVYFEGHFYTDPGMSQSCTIVRRTLSL